MKKIFTTAALVLAMIAPALAYTPTAKDYEYSPNSKPGENIYLCNPKFVEEGRCYAVDDRYYKSMALLEFGPYDISVLEFYDYDGTYSQAIALRGGISTGMTEQVKKTFEAFPDAKFFIMSSAGGNQEEGIKLGQYLSTLNVTAWVSTGRVCMSACADAFIGAPKHRITGQLGFHSAWYNRSLFASSDVDEVIKSLTDRISNDMARTSAWYARAGFNVEFGIDIAKLNGRFLMFRNTEDLNVYRNQNMDFDAIDSSKFAKVEQTVEEQNAEINEYKNVQNAGTEGWITVLRKQVVFDSTSE